MLQTTNLSGLGKKYHGKVRDFYIVGDKRIIVTTDRQSAFDRNLGLIPHKGAVLNLLAAFWFFKTREIVDNHMLAIPHPNVLVAKNCQPIPVEMIVRGYLSGVTKTSIWYSYARGERTIYGIKFPEKMRKNQRLPKPIITPTTHPLPGLGLHDKRLTKEEIVKKKIVPARLYEEMERVSLKLFNYGRKICERKGLILVDTKYEFGLYKNKLILIDEIHTPDSSRLWTKESYLKRFKAGQEPENFDKEFLRLWYAKRGYLGEGVAPKMSQKLISDLAKRYIAVYEKITGRKFIKYRYPVNQTIASAVKEYLSTV